jgi:hypothetical protein
MLLKIEIVMRHFGGNVRIQLLILISVTIVATAPAQWFDPESLSNTVLIEKWQDTSFVPHGTGFVLHNYADPSCSINVTAGHLLNRSELYVSVNADSALIRYARTIKADTLCFKKLKWALTEGKLRCQVRLLASPPPRMLIDTLNDIGIFLTDLPTWVISKPGDTLHCAPFKELPRSMFRYKKDVALGDGLYFLGFPFGIGVLERLDPVIRSGSIAWLSQSSNEFLLDAFSFGGNSGSPLFSKITLGRKPGTLEWEGTTLVGMVVGHLGDSTQNWGLARCVWIDQISKLADRAGTLSLSD